MRFKVAEEYAFNYRKSVYFIEKHWKNDKKVLENEDNDGQDMDTDYKLDKLDSIRLTQVREREICGLH